MPQLFDFLKRLNCNLSVKPQDCLKDIPAGKENKGKGLALVVLYIKICRLPSLWVP